MTMMTSNGMVVPVAMTSTQSYFGYPAQQQQLYQPLMSPPTMQGQGYPFPYVTSPPAMAPAYSRSSSHSHSHTNSRPSSSRHSSRSTSHSYSQSQLQLNPMPQSPPLQSPPYSAPYGQVYHSPSNQPVVVPINGGSGGYVVVPAGQSVHVLPHPQSYAYPDYQHNHQQHYDSDSDSDHEPTSFFGSLSLKKLGASLSGRKSKRRGSRDGY